jgi:integrase
MTNYTFELDTRTARKDGTSALRVKLYRSRLDYVFVGLKMYYLPEQWDARRQLVTNLATAQIENARLNAYRVIIGRLLLEVDESDDVVPMTEIRQRIQTALGQKQQRPTDFYSYFEQCALKIAARKTRESFLMTLKKMQQYERVGKPFSQVSAGWLRGFDEYCRDAGLSVNSIAIFMRNIRTIYNRAIDDGVAQLNDYPFRRFKIKQERTRKRALSVEQLRQLRDFPCTESQRQYRDIFMLIFYLGGINIGDLFRLTEIEGGYIYYSRSKTHRPYQIRVEPEALEIIERYRGKTHLLSAADRYANHEDFTRRINRALQTIGSPEAEKPASKPGPAPIDKKRGAFPGLTTYWARHTVASLMSEIDIPKDTIAKVLGHADNSVTDIYIRFDQKKIDEAMRRMIDFVNEK